MKTKERLNESNCSLSYDVVEIGLSVISNRDESTPVLTLADITVVALSSFGYAWNPNKVGYISQMNYN